jgi:hypothetical protein
MFGLPAVHTVAIIGRGAAGSAAVVVATVGARRPASVAIIAARLIYRHI